jgi:RNA polymerase sigma factor (sigma-70 family)
MEFTTPALQSPTKPALLNHLPAQRTEPELQPDADQLTPAQQELAAEHFYLVERALVRYCSRYQDPEFEDRLGDGAEGLCRAAKMYDADHEDGASFATFATRRILGAMVDGYRVATHMNRQTKERRTMSPLFNRSVMSILDSREVEDEEQGMVAEFLKAPGDLENDTVHSLLTRTILDTVEGRDRKVLQGLMDNKTLAQIGRELGVTESRVSQLVSRIRSRLEPFRKDLLDN